MRRTAALLAVVSSCVGPVACTSGPARSGHRAATQVTPAPLSLRCSDSVGQQGGNHETVIGGVEGLVLPGSGDPAALYPIGAASGGDRYYIYKAFLAVSAAAAPFATVSVARPASARLVYGSPSRIGALFSTRAGQGLLTASRSAVRLPVCGTRFTGFTGGVLVTGPACVTFAVSSPHRQAAAVTVPIGAPTC